MDSIFQLNLTCGGCPEQYDVFSGGQYVGYIRLRHGYFRVDDAHGTTVFSTGEIPGPGGVFSSVEDREKFLTLGLNKLLEALGQNQVPRLYTITDTTHD